jgi:hypothetical protein
MNSIFHRQHNFVIYINLSYYCGNILNQPNLKNLS